MTLTGVQGWMLGGQSRLTYSQSSNFSQLLTESEVFGCFLMQSTVFLGACGKFPSWQRSCLFHFNYLFGMHLGLKKQPCGCMHIAYRELESWYTGWKISSTTKPYKIWKSFTFNGIGTASTYGIAKLYNWCTVYKWIWSLEIYIGTCTGPTTNMFLYSLRKFLFPSAASACPPGRMPRFKLELELGGSGQIEVLPAGEWWALNPANKRGFPKNTSWYKKIIANWIVRFVAINMRFVAKSCDL